MKIADRWLEIRIGAHTAIAARFEQLGRLAARRSAFHAIEAVRLAMARSDGARRELEGRRMERVA